MGGTVTFFRIIIRYSRAAAMGGRAGIAVFGASILLLSGCVAYDPYPPQTSYYYPPSPYYAAPAPSYYYYRPCCATYFDFGYSHGHGRRYYGHGHH